MLCSFPELDIVRFFLGQLSWPITFRLWLLASMFIAFMYVVSNGDVSS